MPILQWIVGNYISEKWTKLPEWPMKRCLKYTFILMASRGRNRTCQNESCLMESLCILFMSTVSCFKMSLFWISSFKSQTKDGDVFKIKINKWSHLEWNRLDWNLSGRSLWLSNSVETSQTSWTFWGQTCLGTGSTTWQECTFSF